MYAENRNYVKFFPTEREGTEKVTYGRLSESLKVTRPGSDEPEYEYETWTAHFVGEAKEKVKNLASGQTIILTKWAARCPYNKEQKRPFPYLLVMDFDLRDEQ